MFLWEQAVAYRAGIASRQASGLCLFIIRAVIILPAVARAPPAGAASAHMALLTIDGAIGPANAHFVMAGNSRTVNDGVELVIIKMDTAGRLLTAMRTIIKGMLASLAPIASHVAAMALSTNLGAAAPVQVGAPGMVPEREKPGPRRKDERAEELSGEKPAPDDGTTAPMTPKRVNDPAACKDAEIKHVDLDESMARAIARQAEAEREQRAKMIHAEGELQASEKLMQAAQVLGRQSGAMQLRYMHTLANIAGDKSSTIMFPLPIDLLTGMAELARPDARTS